MRNLSLLVLLACSMSVFGQATKPVTKRAPVLDRNSFYAAFQRLRFAADKVLGLDPMPSVKPDRGNEAVTREEIIKMMGDALNHYKPKFRSIPRPSRVAHDAIEQRITEAARPLAEKLVAWGFVAPEGPLVVGPGDHLTAQQVGDALGIYFSQLSLLTHRAIPKWTPRLEPLDGG
jgi:hypothetical protein